jgi:hypothetical protein
MLTIGQLVGDSSIGRLPIDLILAAAALNAVLTAILLYPARAAVRRWMPDEAPAW